MRRIWRQDRSAYDRWPRHPQAHAPDDNTQKLPLDPRTRHNLGPPPNSPPFLVSQAPPPSIGFGSSAPNCMRNRSAETPGGFLGWAADASSFRTLPNSLNRARPLASRGTSHSEPLVNRPAASDASGGAGPVYRVGKLRRGKVEMDRTAAAIASRSILAFNLHDSAAGGSLFAIDV
jgi:hypothetical protein